MIEGAVLCLPVHAKDENTVASADFGWWMIRNIDRWFTWARQLGLRISSWSLGLIAQDLGLMSLFLGAGKMHRRLSGKK